jgi:ferritin-like metal-binding protein YciE
MPVNNPKELVVTMLSDLRQSSENMTKIYQEFSKIAQDEDIKEALEARAYISGNILATLDEAFKLLGAKPVKLSGHTRETFIEDFRKEVAEIKSPEVRRLFILAKLTHLIHWRIGEYVALIAAADRTGNYGVGVLLESCLADHLAFAERTKRFLRERWEERKEARKAA